MSNAIVYKIVEAAGSGTLHYYIPVPVLSSLKEIRLVGNATSTAHNDNHAILTFKGNDHATVLATRSTDANGGGSTITGGTLENLGILNDEKAVYTTAQTAMVTVVQAGSGVALDLTLLCMFDPARLQA